MVNRGVALKLIVAVVVGLVGGAAWIAWWIAPPPMTSMSPEWLARQASADDRAGAAWEGVAIRWPINKIVNEHHGFQTRRLRRRR